MRIVQLAFILGILVSGCTSTREGTTGKGQSDILTAEEIAETTAQNAYDAISLKRPFFLKSRGPRSLHEAPAGQTVEFPIVYVNGMYYGELESLRNIHVSQVREIHYLDHNAATLRFGTGHTGGIILVMLREGVE
jgi:hypothetical protein